MTTAAIITAGGIGRRMGGTQPKQFLPLAGTPILVHTINAFTSCTTVDSVVLVVPHDHQEETKALLDHHGLSRTCVVVPGGATRQESVFKGLQKTETDYVVVHDAVRPLVSSQLIRQCLDAAKKHGAAIAATPVADTIKSVHDRLITETIDRTTLWRAQTPQVVRRDLLTKAYALAGEKQFTDEASLLENMGIPVAIVSGPESNIKITRPEDLRLAESLLAPDVKIGDTVMKIGHGYDVHTLVPGRDLILGGAPIPHHIGLLGHSDADVLSHALCDALLGAACLGDIGQHFPDTDEQYKGISSLALLEKVIARINEQGLQLSNADLTVIAQRPKIASYLPKMRENISACCGVSLDRINIKATTTEGLGFPGREEGIACHAVVLVTAHHR